MGEEDVQNISSCVQDILKLHFKSYPEKYQMFLYLFAYEKSLENIEVEGQVDDSYASNVVNKRCENKCHYANRIVQIADSRMENFPNEGKKAMQWIIAGKKPCESNRILANIILNELTPKFYDMLIIEDMNMSKWLAFASFPKESNNKFNFFYKNLFNKDWLLKEFVRDVIKKYNLPKSDEFIQLSAMMYEKRTIQSRIYFSVNDIPDKQENIFFENGNGEMKPILFINKNLRTVRKLLELTGENYGLWVKMPENKIQGSVRVSDIEGVLCVTLDKHLVWGLMNGNEKIFEYREGFYSIPAIQPEMERNAQLEELSRFNDMVEADKIENIKNVVRKIVPLCTHGSSIVFMSNNAEKEGIVAEVKRLAGRNKAYQVKQFPLVQLADEDKNIIDENAEMDRIRGITSIDGAIFCDLDCQCWAVGVIVDGETIIEGDYGRGARFNTITNYIAGYKMKNPDNVCFAVIISEDGMINVVPNKEVEEKIQRLKNEKQSKELQESKN